MKTCICTPLVNELMDITVDSSYPITLKKLYEVLVKIENNDTSNNISLAEHEESIHIWLK